MSIAAARSSRNRNHAGIGYWMARVLAERRQVEAAFAPDPVHDFRVALRRCRSIAEGFREVEPDPMWNRMRAASKTVFAAFGELRDVQVLREWIAKLGAGSPAVSTRLDSYCAAREQELKVHAATALRSFDERAWSRWAEALQARARRLPPGGAVFQVLALQRWEAARHLHSLALRNRSRIAYHRLRIGIKRFRYLVENFLPAHHARWSKDLKRLQDILGEVHDLDVLWQTACAQNAFATSDERKLWQEAIQRERAQRLAIYRERMVGRNSLWQQWRDGLPSGNALRRAVAGRFAGWASFQRVDKVHTARVLRFSLAMFDALSKAGLLTCGDLDGVPSRDLLAIAASVHEAGRKKGAAAHPKRTRRMLAALDPPPGWTKIHLQAMALVARYHRGALPASSYRPYRSVPQKARRAVDELAAILRLAAAFDSRHDRSITGVHLSRQAGVILIRAAGYRDRTVLAQRIAAARHLLETVTGLPVAVTADS